MKTKVSSILLISFLMISITSCKKSDTLSNEGNIETKLPAYEVLLMPKEEGSEIVDVLLENSETGEVKTLITLSDAVQSHYHNAEYHNGKLFILREVEKGTSDFSDDEISLWLYQEDGNGYQFISAKSLDFRASSSGAIVAVCAGEELIFIDDGGKVLFLFELFDITSGNELLLNASIGLEGWSADSSIFWGNLFLAAYKASFYQVRIDEGTLESYDLTGLAPIGWDYSLNKNIGKLVFSDHPVFFDVQSSDNFKESSKAVTLYLLDLKSMEIQPIDQSLAEVFYPTWIYEVSFTYENPEGDGRITYTSH
ncbi:MAG TPA: hypothetical protein G4N92_01270 [Anaerolineae bacterium]|nr:hypothetical protein [Anaerolineae bacterium]